MRSIRNLFIAAALVVSSVGAFAQSHELAITAGGNFPSNNQYNPNNSFVVGAQYAGRILYLPLISLYGELPVVVATHSGFNEPIACATSSSCNVRNAYSAAFVTPGLKLKFGSELPLSPYVVAGVGVAHYKTANAPTFGDDSVNKAVFDVGGGLDMKIVPFFSVRGEVRDFISGTPNIAAIQDTGKQHNVIAQLGLVFRF